MNPPLIIIGMHRSGTTLVVRILRELGWTAGAYREQNEESVFFQLINVLLMRQAGGRWDHPEPVRHLLEDRQLRASYVASIKRLVGSPLIIGYLGVVPFLRGVRLELPTVSWGFKDPRNTYTLPLWLDVFPGAKVLHVIRHGVDVASSLQVRSADRRSRSLALARERPLLHLMGTFAGPLSRSSPIDEIDGGIRLWAKYVAAARATMKEYAGSVSMEVRFEDLTSDPEYVVASLAEFAGLDVTSGRVAQVTAGIDRSRSFAFRSNRHLAEVAKRHSDVLAASGYGP